MSDKPETIDAILAEMRNGYPFEWSRAQVDSWLDRIEAAVARERNAHTNDIHDALYKATGIHGNAAAMREALKSIIGNLMIHIQCGRLVAPGDHVSFAIAEAEEYIRDARAALAAPARNVDRFATAEEARTAFLCDARNTEGLDHLVRLTEIVGRVCDWLFAPAEGKEADHA